MVERQTRRCAYVVALLVVAAWTSPLTGTCHAEDDGIIYTTVQEGDAVRFHIRVPVEELREVLATRPLFDGVRLEPLPHADGEPRWVLVRSDQPIHTGTWRMRVLWLAHQWLVDLRRARALDNDALHDRLRDAAFAERPARRYLDNYLTEVQRRGGDEWIERLHQLSGKLRGSATDPTPTAARRPSYDRALEVDTVIARMTSRPDPIRVVVSQAGRATYPDQPRVEVRLVNDCDRPVLLLSKGWNRMRDGSVFVDVRRSDGSVVLARSVHPSEGSLRGGPRWLQVGESDLRTLRVRSYVEHLTPGEYQVRVLYSNSGGIDYPYSQIGGIAFASEWVDLTVDRRVIHTVRAQQLQLETLVESLSATALIRVVRGEYGPWARRIIAPESAAGQLLSAGWNAVPAIVAFASREDVDPVRRARALSLLESITGVERSPSIALYGAHDVYEESSRRKRPRPPAWTVKTPALGIEVDEQLSLARAWSDIVETMVFEWE